MGERTPFSLPRRNICTPKPACSLKWQLVGNYFKKSCRQLGMVVQAWNPSTWEVEAGDIYILQEKDVIRESPVLSGSLASPGVFSLMKLFPQMEGLMWAWQPSEKRGLRSSVNMRRDERSWWSHTARWSHGWAWNQGILTPHVGLLSGRSPHTTSLMLVWWSTQFCWGRDWHCLQHPARCLIHNGFLIYADWINVGTILKLDPITKRKILTPPLEKTLGMKQSSAELSVLPMSILGRHLLIDPTVHIGGKITTLGFH
jgi:hypothetical protein